MGLLLTLVQRNIRVYLRDRAAVFFSFLSVAIIVGLYVVFLGNLQVQTISEKVGDIPGIRSLVASWVMAGILIVSTVTIPLGMLGTLVEDEDRKRLKDFLVAPVGRAQLIGGYLVSSCVMGAILCFVTLVLAEGYILLEGGQILSWVGMIKVLGLILLSTVSNTAIMAFFVTFLRSTSAFAVFSTITGTMMGFLTGIYVPIGVLPSTVQALIKMVPASYGAALMRQIFMEKPIREVFLHAPTVYRHSYEKINGVQLFIGEKPVEPWLILVVLVLTGGLFFALSVYRMLKRR